MDKYIRTLKREKRRLLSFKNVVGVGVGYKLVKMERTEQPALIIFVEKKIPKEAIPGAHFIPPKFAGLETDVIEIGKVRLLSRTSRERPAQPGVSIGHFLVTAGTFGAVVKDRKTGEPLILSNNHVLANVTNGRDGRAQIGDPILQPGSYDGGTEKDRIGELLRFVPLHKGEEEVECPVASAIVRGSNEFLKILRPNYKLRMLKLTNNYNLVDAAVARPDSPEMINPEIFDFGVPEGVREDVDPGLLVMKSGRTSGLTKGSVIATDVTITVGMGESGSAEFTEQVATDMISRPGDSGSLVLSEDKMIVGLLFAGSEQYTIFNLIRNVMDQLDIKI